MRIDFAAFWLHKDGGEPRQYEEAFAPADDFAGAIAHDTGTWRSGGAFYVMNALACWFWAATERGERPWNVLDRFARTDRAGFRRWVHALRPAALKNDDVTPLRIVARA